MDTKNLPNTNNKELQHQLDLVKNKLRKYIKKTQLADQKVYEYSLEVEYLSGLLNIAEKNSIK